MSRKDGEEKGTISLLVGYENETSCESGDADTTVSEIDVQRASNAPAAPISENHASHARLEYLDTFRGFIMLIMVRLILNHNTIVLC